MTSRKPAKPTRIVQRGNGHSYYLDGVKVPGVTTILNGGIPKPALVDWAAKTTAAYAVDRWDELDGLRPSERLAKLERARWDKTEEAAARGTDVHELAHRLGRGEEVEVPPALDGYVRAYLDFTNDFDVEEVMAEFVVVKRLPWVAYMGKPDLYAYLTIDGVRESWLLDWKTGKGVYAEAALQLAAYNDADEYLDDAGDPVAYEPADRLGVVHLRADGYELRPVVAEPEDSPAALAVFQYCTVVAEYADAPRGTYLGDAIRP